MKNIKYLLTLLFSFLLINSVNAHSISDIKMDIYLRENGDAHITEEWVADFSRDTEGYKQLLNLGSSEISNFKVYMDNELFTYVNNWDIHGNFDSKKYKNGFNYVSNGVELCFGITDYGKHTYKLEYDITGFVASLEDSDMIDWKLITQDFALKPDNAYIKIYSDFDYDKDTTEVWGFGYKGYAYVYDGYIEMVSDGSLKSNEYMTILVKFPKGTFKSYNKINNEFNYYYNLAMNGAKQYKESPFNVFLNIIRIIFMISFYAIPALIIYNEFRKFPMRICGKRLRPNDLEIIDKKVPMFRDIPCDKNIFKAYFLSCLYHINSKDSDFLGAVLLKWLKEGKIEITKTEAKFLKKETTAFKFNTGVIFENDFERKLYDMMVEASGDNILESKEFERWCKNHYSKIFNFFDDVKKDIFNSYEREGYFEKIKIGRFIKTSGYLITTKLFEETKKVAGLKIFLKEFSIIDQREAIEVHNWDEYLMFAQIFGIAAKVAKQFKKLYPEVFENPENNMYNGFNYDNIVLINSISTSGMTSASTARSRAESYSSGGGGHSFSGGGGGSFGGGGGGTR